MTRETSAEETVAAAAGATVRTLPGRAIDPAASWRKHAAKMPLVAAAVLALGLPVAWFVGKPKFYAESAVRVAPTYVKNLQDEADIQLASTTQYLQFVQQQVTTVRSFAVAVAALRDLGAQRSLWQREDETDRRAAERLMASLAVRPVKDTYLITVGLEGGEAHGLAEIVNAVTGAYLREAGEEGMYGSDLRSRRLVERREELQAQIDRDVARVAEIAQELGVSTFEDTQLNPLDSALVATRDALAEAGRRRVAAEARLVALQEAQAREGKLELDSAARESLDRNQALISATKLYYDRRNALLAQVSGLSNSHPGYAAIQRQLREIESELSRVTTAEVDGTKAVLSQRRATRAAEELSRAQLEVDQTRRVEADLAREHDAQQARMAAYATQYQSAIDLTANIRRARKRVETISNRIDSFSLESQAPGFVRVVSPARPAEQPIAGGHKKLLLVVCLAAVAAALAAPLAIDRLNPRILVPGDVEPAVGMAPLGWIAERSDTSTAALALDQVRRIALTLQRERQENGTARVAFTAAQAGAGTTTLALDVGRELTRLGVRAVVVEANYLRADARFGRHSAAGGLAEVLAGRAKAADVVVPGNAGVPDRVALGDCAPVDVSHPRFRAAIDELGEGYDIVLLDAPPLLLTSDAEVLARTAGAAVLVVAANTVSKAALQASGRALERLSLPVVGTVLNRVRIHEHPRSLAALLPAGVLGAAGAGAEGEDAGGLGSRVQRWLWA